MKQYQKDWLAKFGPLAKANEQRHGVPALFTLAQQLVESAWSMKKLGNNFFGVKSHGWSGAVNNQKTHEYSKAGQKYDTRDVFRAYNTPAAAYEGHAQFLHQQPRYRAAFAHTDPVLFAKAIADAKYATDPKYFEKLRTNIYFLRGQKVPTTPVSEGGGAAALLVLAGLGYWLHTRKGATS